MPPLSWSVIALRDLAALVLTTTPRLGTTRLIVIDGPAGSGKTRLASLLADEVQRLVEKVVVLHMDDLYRGWETDFAETLDRLDQQVLAALTAGRPAAYQRYDWHAGGFGEWVSVPACDVLVVEGVGAGGRSLEASLSLLVWVEAPAHVRIRRGVERDGRQVLPRWRAWMQHEEAEHVRQRTRARAHVRIDGHPGPGVDPPTEVLADRDIEAVRSRS